MDRQSDKRPRTWPGRAAALMLAGLAGSGPAHALDTLSAADLAAMCGAPSPGDAACLGYVRGFIDGAIATDPRVTLNVARELGGPESFTERAYRTRLGDTMTRFGPSYFAEFCIPVPVPLANIATLIRDELAAGYPAGESARDFVYGALREAYPCDRPEGAS